MNSPHDAAADASRARVHAPFLRRAVVALGGAAVLVSVLLPVTANAHNYVVSSTPAEGATVTEAPDAFSITTNEDMLDLGGKGSGFALQVTDAEGLYYGDGCVTVTGPTMSTNAAFGGAGAYTVEWQAVSIDGHTISGEYAFTWAPTAAYDWPAGSATPPVCGEPTTPVASAAPVEIPVATPSAETSSAASGETSPAAAPSSSSVAAPSGDDPAGSADSASAGSLLAVGGVAAATAAVVAALVLSRRRAAGRG